MGVIEFETQTDPTLLDEACCFVFLVETGESRTPR